MKLNGNFYVKWYQSSHLHFAQKGRWNWPQNNFPIWLVCYEEKCQGLNFNNQLAQSTNALVALAHGVDAILFHQQNCA